MIGRTRRNGTAVAVVDARLHIVDALNTSIGAVLSSINTSLYITNATNARINVMLSADYAP
jgi:hypothetical protein